MHILVIIRMERMKCYIKIRKNGENENCLLQSARFNYYWFAAGQVMDYSTLR